METQTVLDFLTRCVKAQPYILGSQLGGKLTRQFPGFTGLRTFVRLYGGDSILVVEGQADDQYVHIESLDAPVQLNAEPGGPPPSSVHIKDPTLATKEESKASSGPISSATHPETAWRAFVTPGSGSRVVVNTATREILVWPSGRSVESPNQLVEPVTLEEHRQIARDFLDQLIDSSDREQFESILLREDYWDDWYRAIKETLGGKYFSVWIRFRISHLKYLFEDRLRSSTLSHFSDLLWQRISDSRKQSVPSALAAESTEHRNSPKKVYSPRRSITIRQLAIEVVGELPEEALRSLRLPLGLIADKLGLTNRGVD